MTEVSEFSLEITVDKMTVVMIVFGLNIKWPQGGAVKKARYAHVFAATIALLAVQPSKSGPLSSSSYAGFQGPSQCVHCAFSEDHSRVCKGGPGDAGFACYALDSSSCIVMEPLIENSATSASTFSSVSTPLRLDKKLIRDIAAKQPRFAATLANLDIFGFQAAVYHIYWTPVKIAAGDVDMFLNRRTSHAFFSALDESARKLNGAIERGTASEIRYDLAVESPDAASRVIRIEFKSPRTSLQGDPSYSLLQIRLSVPISSKDGRRCLATDWQIN